MPAVRTAKGVVLHPPFTFTGAFCKVTAEEMACMPSDLKGETVVPPVPIDAYKAERDEVLVLMWREVRQNTVWNRVCKRLHELDLIAQEATQGFKYSAEKGQQRAQGQDKWR